MMPVLSADLHIHTTASDGLLAPAAVVKAAKDAGLAIIALTDHDTTAGLEQGMAAGKQHDIRVFPGLELSAELAGSEVHILGYRIDCQNQKLQSWLASIKEARVKRLQAMVARLGELGFELDWREVSAQAVLGSSLGRPHLARLMVKKGFAGSVKEVFDCWIGNGGPAYVPRFKLNPAQAIDIVKSAGGLAFLAHPGLLKTKELADEVAAMGLDGIEVYHPRHRSKQVALFKDMALRLGLHISGGSDYHGTPAEKLGATFVGADAIPWLLD